MTVDERLVIKDTNGELMRLVLVLVVDATGMRG